MANMCSVHYIYFAIDYVINGEFLLYRFEKNGVTCLVLNIWQVDYGLLHHFVRIRRLRQIGVYCVNVNYLRVQIDIKNKILSQNRVDFRNGRKGNSKLPQKHLYFYHSAGWAIIWYILMTIIIVKRIVIKQKRNKNIFHILICVNRPCRLHCYLCIVIINDVEWRLIIKYAPCHCYTDNLELFLSAIFCV